jgi:hypothetical protein
VDDAICTNSNKHITRDKDVPKGHQVRKELALVNAEHVDVAQHAVGNVEQLAAANGLVRHLVVRRGLARVVAHVEAVLDHEAVVLRKRVAPDTTQHFCRLAAV